MKANLDKQVTVTLTLTEEEARWIMVTVQNPIEFNGVEETVEDAQMRKELWDTLYNSLKLA